MVWRFDGLFELYLVHGSTQLAGICLVMPDVIFPLNNMIGILEGVER